MAQLHYNPTAAPDYSTSARLQEMASNNFTKALSSFSGIADSIKNNALQEEAAQKQINTDSVINAIYNSTPNTFGTDKQKGNYAANNLFDKYGKLINVGDVNKALVGKETTDANLSLVNAKADKTTGVGGFTNEFQAKQAEKTFYSAADQLTTDYFKEQQSRGENPQVTEELVQRIKGLSEQYGIPLSTDGITGRSNTVKESFLSNSKLTGQLAADADTFNTLLTVPKNESQNRINSVMNSTGVGRVYSTLYSSDNTPIDAATLRKELVTMGKDFGYSETSIDDAITEMKKTISSYSKLTPDEKSHLLSNASLLKLFKNYTLNGQGSGYLGDYFFKDNPLKNDLDSYVKLKNSEFTPVTTSTVDPSTNTPKVLKTFEDIGNFIKQEEEGAKLKEVEIRKHFDKFKNLAVTFSRNGKLTELQQKEYDNSLAYLKKVREQQNVLPK